jgi:hypothetical protein
MKSLSEMVGEEIAALVPVLNQRKLQVLKLRGIETGGIWVESQALTNQFLEMVGAQTAPRTLAIFVPYDKILFLLGFEDVPSLSEKAFGLGTP